MTRARALITKSLGISGTREVAAAATLGDALRQLAATPYRRYVTTDASLAQAQRAVSATLLWHLRVLAGWLPYTGTDALRLLAAGFEIANAEQRLRSLTGGSAPQPYRLGSLATASRRIGHAAAPSELRAALASSAWGDPGGDSPAAMATGMRISAAAHTAERLPPARRWATGRAAVLVGRELFVHGRPLTEQTARRASELLGRRTVEASSFEEFRAFLPRHARWPVADIADAGELWRAEARWWTALEEDGVAMTDNRGYDLTPVVGAVAVLSVDAWRVRAALELAARGGGSLEVVFDAVV
ncbi:MULTISPECIES: hypothetical protein [unclassified Streptomyces]|uniref:hypothetical protein n=1 Tax=unclassified Streptomyces TaxID=2593676 RepID=UPI002DDA0F96|nr:hypothetical protein [Streptomyces sp. NBC_01750]WSB04402.1 V-type ATPase subunit [Streptomyces sp. NBC_01794]WSD31316.1 V-type ATPase subunit [Streptomyces sp. NBC_01750]